MSAIKSCNTKPEQHIRKALHRKGYRFSLNSSKLPGKPDIVLSKYKAVLFVHGCFWHCHNCHMFKWPRTRKEFWDQKIERNVQNDKKKQEELLNSGWRVGVIWECAVKGKKRLTIESIMEDTIDWLHSGLTYFQIEGSCN